MFKKCKVVILDGNKSKISFYDNILAEKRNSLFEYKKNCVINPQNIYIISEDTPQIYDFILDVKENKIYQIEMFSKSLGFFSGKTFCFIQNHHKKIISTTDRSLRHDFNMEFENTTPTIQGNCCHYSIEESYLPRPSQQFIEKYISEYNKGNVITEVNVEYEEYLEEDTSRRYILGQGQPAIKISYPKVDKNNHISITKVKDSWTREEIEMLIKKAISDTNKSNNRNVSMNDVKWIKENL